MSWPELIGIGPHGAPVEVFVLIRPPLLCSTTGSARDQSTHLGGEEFLFYHCMASHMPKFLFSGGQFTHYNDFHELPLPLGTLFLSRRLKSDSSVRFIQHPSYESEHCIGFFRDSTCRLWILRARHSSGEFIIKFTLYLPTPPSVFCCSKRSGTCLLRPGHRAAAKAPYGGPNECVALQTVGTCL